MLYFCYHLSFPLDFIKLIDTIILTSAFQVITKILKHSREASSTTAHGLLLGLDLDGILEVSNSFALPNHTNDDDDKATKSIGRPFSLLLSLWYAGTHKNFLSGRSLPDIHAPVPERGSGR